MNIEVVIRLKRNPSTNDGFDNTDKG